jgi:high-affinity Fe2+/Pb2+ permease
MTQMGCLKTLQKGIMTRTLILISLLAGFVLAFLGVLIMFHSGEVWMGFGITLVGFYAVIRAVHRSHNATSN